MRQLLPFITREVTMQLEESMVFFSTQKQEALRSLPGNPYGVHIRSFGNATAFLTQRTYNADRTSHVLNIGGDDLSSLDALLECIAPMGCTVLLTLHPQRLLRPSSGTLSQKDGINQDPSKATGSVEEQQAVYRSVRDAIRARIENELIQSV